MRHPIFMPHEWLAALYKEPVLFKKLLLGNPGELAKYWHNESTHPLEHSEYLTDGARTLPLVLHGDDAGVGRKTKMFVLSTHSPLPFLNSVLNFLLISVLSGEQIIPGVTLQRLYEQTVWSFECCRDGTFPLRDLDFNDVTHRGAGWLAEMWKAIVSWIEGDWKWTKEAFEMNAYDTDACCANCGADKKIKNLLYTDYGGDAGWRLWDSHF